MRYSVLATGFLALAVSACAAFSPLRHSRDEDRFAAGMAALRRGDYAQASVDLGWVAEHAKDRAVGQQALLIVSALEVDPRNPRRRLGVGADLAASYLRQTDVSPWTEPVAQSLYLLSLELGAAEERAAQAEADRLANQKATELPKFPEATQTVPAKLRAANEEREKLSKRVEQLEEQLADRDKKLAEKDKELERIKKTLKS